MNPANFYNKLNNSGYMQNITNNINIKNVNIINCNEPSHFSTNKQLLFNNINVYNDLKNNNNIINSNNNYCYDQNKFINLLIFLVQLKIIIKIMNI